MKHQTEIDAIIERAFREDIGSGDITTIATIPNETLGEAKFIAKAKGIIAGLEITERVFYLYDNSLVFKSYLKDGDLVEPGYIIAEVKGKASSILTAERTSLNFLQRMSGIASLANKFSREISHTKAVIIDTRKTVPGLRILDKMAVEMGGCKNHRMGLFDMFLIKDNHIAASGSISKAVEDCRRYMKETGKSSKIEVEVTNLEQTREALESKADIIMLDNFDIDLMADAVSQINGMAKIEASGGINLSTVRAVAETGVDYISVGALTHSVQALDISLILELVK